MKRLFGHKLLPSLLAINALLVAALLLSVLLRGQDFLPAAFAQAIPSRPAPDIEVVPAQMSTNTWGCYIVDKRNNTICAYQYIPGERMLRFQAARGFSNDLDLTNFNTSPEPAEIRSLLEKERSAPANRPAGSQEPAPAGQK